MFDFLHRRTPWHRRLWAPGTVLGLHEVVEYSQVRRDGGLPPDGLKYVAEAMKREVEADPACAAFKAELVALLDKGHTLGPNDEEQILHLANRAGDQYLDRWTAAVAGADSPSYERTARSVTAHLLDQGFSSDHLYRWLDADRHNHDAPALDRLLAEATAMVRTTAARTYDVLVPCFVPGPPADLPPSIVWRDAEATAIWLDDQRPGEAKPRQGGSFTFAVSARDPWAAVETVNDLMARISARVQVGRPGVGTVRTAGVAYISGNAREFVLQPPRRQLDIHALHRQGVLYKVDPADALQLDDALELAAYMETGSAGAAVTGGWAAIEGVLLYPGEKGHVVAADRLARIVACSVGRAELTPLARVHEAHGDDQLAADLQALDDEAPNFVRVQLVERHLRNGGDLAVEDLSDRAAVDRISAILANPATELSSICRYIQDTFRRLYNQRNLVMHGGTFRSVALPATLRTAPPLVGAGLDRVVHARLAARDPIEPLALSARAEAELRMQGSDAGSWLVDLLGR